MTDRKDSGIENELLPHRPLGRTGLMVSCVGLGGMGVISRTQKNVRDGVEVIITAIDSGINFIDTARGYFDSEQITGLALQERPGRAYVATKTYMRGARQAEEEIRKSLEALQLKKIDLMQVHHVQYEVEFEQVIGRGGAMEALRSYQKQGLIDFIGVSSHNPRILPQILESDIFDTVQFPFNPIETEHYEKVKDVVGRRNIGTIIMKPLAGGNLKSVDKALRFILGHPVSTVIPGCITPDQVRQCVQAGYGLGEMTEEERAQLLEEARSLPERFCRRCRYCEGECSRQIPISDVFRCENYLIFSATYARDEYRGLSRHFNDCISCGKCEKICPYQLPVRQMLKRAHHRLTRGWLEDAAVKVLRKAGLYDAARKIYFALGGKIPER